MKAKIATRIFNFFLKKQVVTIVKIIKKKTAITTQFERKMCFAKRIAPKRARKQ